MRASCIQAICKVQRALFSGYSVRCIEAWLYPAKLRDESGAAGPIFRFAAFTAGLRSCIAADLSQKYMYRSAAIASPAKISGDASDVRATA